MHDQQDTSCRTLKLCQSAVHRAQHAGTRHVAFAPGLLGDTRHVPSLGMTTDAPYAHYRPQRGEGGQWVRNTSHPRRKG
jgi:hypothetical protein